MKRRWILLPLLGVAGYFAVFGGEYSWLDLRRLVRERQAQEKAVAATRREVKSLRARADSLERDSLTLERLAREQYGLIRSGERLYRFAPFAAPDSSATAAPGSAPAAGDTSSGKRLQTSRDTAHRDASAAPGARAAGGPR